MHHTQECTSSLWLVNDTITSIAERTASWLQVKSLAPLPHWFSEAEGCCCCCCCCCCVCCCWHRDEQYMQHEVDSWSELLAWAYSCTGKQSVNLAGLSRPPSYSLRPGVASTSEVPSWHTPTKHAYTGWRAILRVLATMLGSLRGQQALKLQLATVLWFTILFPAASSI